MRAGKMKGKGGKEGRLSSLAACGSVLRLGGFPFDFPKTTQKGTPQKRHTWVVHTGRKQYKLAQAII